MIVPIKLLPGGKLPAYATEGASGMDCYARLASPRPINPGEYAAIPCGFMVELPHGCEAQIRPRSGLAFNAGLVGFWGTIDEDYRGEVHGLLFNFGDKVMIIENGDRICQMVIAPVTRAELYPVEELATTARGASGFGSTGK